ncbi:MAG TPA: hypothetical protein VGM41_11585, partial [Chitinophagaceae bacterium]
MSANPPVHSYGRRLFRKIARIILVFLGSVLLLIIIIILLVQTPWIQNIARKKAQRYLADKLHTRVEINKLRISFPDHVSLGGIYLEDRQQDTLLSGKKIEVGVNMWKLFHGELALGDVKLEGITCKIKRALPDTTFNFQFIINAFASKTPAAPKSPADTSTFAVTLRFLQLDSVRLVYKDVVTGNDLETWIGHTRVSMKELNTAAQQFAVASLQLKDTRVRFYRTRPLLTAIPAKKETNTPPSRGPYFSLQSFLLDHVLLDYRDSVSALYTQADVKRLAGEVQGMDIERQVFRLKSIALDSSAVQFDNGNDPRNRQGMDYSHIKAEGFTLHASNLLYNHDSISAIITAASLKEQSGFELDKLQTNFLYSSNEARLDNLDLRTPHTVLRDFVRVRYPALTAFSKKPGSVNIDLSLRNSQVQLKDVLNFAPQLAKQELFRHPTDIVRVNTRVTGTLGSMNVQQLQVSGIGSTVVDLSGTIRNPTDTKNFQASLQVKNIITTKKDLLALLPPGSLPSNTSIPENLRLSGRLDGGTKEMNADLVLVSSSGTLMLKGYIHPLTDIKNAAYDLHLETQQLDVGYILQDPANFGTLTGVFYAKGKGTDPHTADGAIQGTISDVTLKGYDYHHLLFNAAIAAQKIKATAAAEDPNLRFHLDLHADIAHKYPALQMVLNVDTVNAYALHFVDSVVTYHGNITADFASIDPDALQGKLIVANSILVKAGNRLAVDSVQLLAGANDSGRFIHIDNEALAWRLSGQYKLTQLGDVFQQSIDPYFSLNKDSAKKAIDPYHFSVNATLTDKPILKTLLPDLKKLSPITFDARFSSNDTLKLSLDAPLVIIGANEINGLQLRANGDRSRLDINLSLARAKAGSLDIYSTSLAGKLANNKADFALNNKDNKGKDR